MQIDVLSNTSQPILVDLQTQGDLLWGKVGIESIKRGKTVQGFDMNLHGWTLIRNKNEIFWEPVTTLDDFGIAEMKYDS